MHRRLITRAVAPVVLLLVLAGLAAGCGSGSSGGSSASGNGVAGKSADQIVAAALTAAKGARSVHISGDTTSTVQPLSFDVDLVAGKGGSGTITANGLTFDIVRIGDKAYFKGSSAFWSQISANPTLAQLFADKWIVGSATSGKLAPFTVLTDLDGFMTTLLTSHGTLKKGTASSVDGNQVIALTDTTKGGTLYVATTGTPYPIKLAKGGNSPGAVTFSAWNKPVTLTAPPNALDLNSLSNGSTSP